MRLLVYPHDLSIGGSQINAIDLASGVAEAGHDVTIYGIPGPLVDYIEQRGLRFLPARPLKYRPAPSRIAQLAIIACKENFDLIHTYEWPPCLDAYLGAGVILGKPILCTVLSMTLMPFVPPSMPLIMGTADLGDEARRIQRNKVWVLEPPIDIIRDHPGIDGSKFRKTHYVDNKELLIVSVSRLAIDLKLDSLVRAIDAVDLLTGKYPLRLIIVGGGPAHDALLERSKAVNKRWMREVVTLSGPESDPRFAYAAADVVLGMGSSALRALAIGRPVIVQGEDAFSEVFEPTTLKLFLKQGFYGIADGSPSPYPLVEQLDGLLSDHDRREKLGRFGRQIVTERFSLERAVRVQLEIYEQMFRTPSRRNILDALRSISRALMLEVENHNPRQKINRLAREKEILAAAKGESWPIRISTSL